MEWYNLRQELDNDPLGRGYASMDSVAASESLNTKNRSRVVDVLDRMTVVRSFVKADLDTIGTTATKRDYLAILTGMEDVPSGAGSYGEWLAQQIFPAGSQTLINLNNARTVPISRADELGLGYVRDVDVTTARGMTFGGG